MKSLLTKIKAKTLSIAEMQAAAGGDCEPMFIDTIHGGCGWDPLVGDYVCDSWSESDYAGENCY